MRSPDLPFSPLVVAAPVLSTRVSGARARTVEREGKVEARKHQSSLYLQKKKTERKNKARKIISCTLLTFRSEEERSKKNGLPLLSLFKKSSLCTMAAEQLAEVSTVDLMTEVARRLECATKPEKRLILIGE